jgi:hypothetical protein
MPSAQALPGDQIAVMLGVGDQHLIARRQALAERQRTETISDPLGAPHPSAA